jgi:hypothetical protein
MTCGSSVSPGPPISSTNKIDRHGINWNIVSKVALKTIKQTKNLVYATADEILVLEGIIHPVVNISALKLTVSK